MSAVSPTPLLPLYNSSTSTQKFRRLLYGTAPWDESPPPSDEIEAAALKCDEPDLALTRFLRFNDALLERGYELRMTPRIRLYIYLTNVFTYVFMLITWLDFQVLPEPALGGVPLERPYIKAQWVTFVYTAALGARGGGAAGAAGGENGGAAAARAACARRRRPSVQP